MSQAPSSCLPSTVSRWLTDANGAICVKGTDVSLQERGGRCRCRRTRRDERTLTLGDGRARREPHSGRSRVPHHGSLLTWMWLRSGASAAASRRAYRRAQCVARDSLDSRGPGRTGHGRAKILDNQDGGERVHDIPPTAQLVSGQTHRQSVFPTVFHRAALDRARRAVPDGRQLRSRKASPRCPVSRQSPKTGP